ncbi:MAG TPA: LTA synthase family protein, partial [Ferruginibacter sp.]|nr:LTA synthase family protein [Ferruginibacter sp.]
ALALFIIFFSISAEFPFWDEFGVRFNFIAVDYLVYTYEVLENINQSYPIPLIIFVLLILIVFTLIAFKKFRIFNNTFSGKTPLRLRAAYTIPLLAINFLLLLFLENKQAETGNNLALNEMGKNGVFSFFAAYRANELDYNNFYPTINDSVAYDRIKKGILQKNQNYTSLEWNNITRNTVGSNAYNPNIILITIESFSADFLKYFGNKNQLTPNFDSLENSSLFFTNMYATGTRTVRGMEALTLCVPPTPGNSIVRRPANKGLFSIATVLKQKNYQLYFIYGGDGYFDNMNNFFSGQGFTIVDRNRNNPLTEKLPTHRYNIPNNEVSFENAWGISDEDAYNQSLKYADSCHKSGKSFFQFIMTTSNHKPYTFPSEKIDLVQGTRNAAVKYTDYALGKYIARAKTQPWFNNTVFVIVADHCASSAGKWEINIDKHHIPALIYNLPVPPQFIKTLASQIDLMPTLFGYLNWNYNSSFYGEDLNQLKPGNEKAFIGNYRTLGMLSNNIFTQLDDRKRVKQFIYSAKENKLTELKTQNKELATQTISYYQTASERFKNGKMKEK